MSAKSPSSDLESTGTTSLFNWASDRLTMDNWAIGDFLKAGLGLTIVGIFAGVMDVFNAIITFFTDPLTSAGSSIASLFSGLVGEPADILVRGAQTTADGIASTFTGFLGPLAFPAAVGSVLVGLYLVTIYLSEQDTSDLFPGSFTDIDTPSWLPFVGDPGVQEEGEDEDRD
jgi:hypothetical protein